MAADECDLWLGARDPEAGQHYLQKHYDRAVVEEGTQAPDFELATDDGGRVRDLRGRPVVLYFYPRDDTLTNNCSKEN